MTYTDHRRATRGTPSVTNYVDHDLDPAVDDELDELLTALECRRQLRRLAFAIVAEGGSSRSMRSSRDRVLARIAASYRRSRRRGVPILGLVSE